MSQWEDPEVDMQHLNITENDTLFVITSAGDSEYSVRRRCFVLFLFRRLTEDLTLFSLLWMRCTKTRRVTLRDQRCTAQDTLC